MDLKTRAKIRAHLGEGLSTDEIADALGLPLSTVTAEVEELDREEQADLSARKPEAWFADYVRRSAANMKALDAVIVDFKGSKQGSALVGAIRMKQEIADRIIDRGQSLGIVDKRPIQTESKVLVAHLDDASLAELLERELRELRALMGGAGPLLSVNVAAEPTAALIVPRLQAEPVASPSPPPASLGLPSAPVRRIGVGSGSGDVVRQRAVTPTIRRGGSST